jgi:hypothetical protein
MKKNKIVPGKKISKGFVMKENIDQRAISYGNYSPKFVPKMVSIKSNGYRCSKKNESCPTLETLLFCHI